MITTDFKRDVILCVDLMSCGHLEYFEVVDYGEYYAIETEDEIRKYDSITEKRID